MNRPLLRCGLIGLCLAMPGVPAGLAQQAPPVRTNVARPKLLPWAWLELRFDGRGGAQATLRTNFPPPLSEIWQHALQAVLHAPLDGVSEKRTPRGWELHAHADGVLRRSDGIVEGTLDLKPLLEVLPLFNVGVLSLSLSHPSAGFSECSEEEPEQSLVATHYSWDVPVASPHQPVHLAFGYAPGQTWRLGLPIAFLLAAVGVCAWLSHRRQAEDGDRFEAWFRAWKIQRRLLVALWLTWLVLVLATGFVPRASFLLCGILPGGEYVRMALCLLLPPALGALVCKVVSAPAFAEVPEVDWTRGRLLAQGIWGQLGAVAVGVCLAYGLDAFQTDPTSNGWLVGVLAALVLLALCAGGRVQARNIGLHVLPPGELRQRLFELAEQIQVRVRQAYLLPAAAWKLLNAVGAAGEVVHVTSEVLPHLSRREVDALLALELAQLARKQRRSLARTLGSFLVPIAVGVCVAVASVFMGPEWFWLVLPLVFLAGVALRSRSRWQHFAPALDRDVLAITGDPEALLTGLAKLHRLQLLPLGAGKERSVFAGPVEDWPRLQDLADRADIPPERLEEILDRPGSGEDRYPHEPADAEPSDRVFSRAFKRRFLGRQNALRMAVEIGTPALTAYLVQWQGWQGVWLIGAYLAGLLLLFLIRRRLERFLSGRTTLALRRGLQDKLAREGFEPNALGGTLVGLSPHSEPRNYEGFLIWDVGFVVLAGERLCYVGDHTRFALDRACVRDVYLGPGMPGWRKAKRVYLAWQDDARGVGGTFNLSVLESRPWWRRGSSAADLEKRLRDWLRQPADSDELPPPLRELSAPDFGTVASQSLAKLGSFGVVLALWMLYAPFTVGACFLLGLSFDPDAGAGAWYVLLVVALRQVAAVLSFLQFRGKHDDSGDADALAARPRPPSARPR